MRIAMKLIVFAVIMLICGYKNSCRHFTEAAHQVDCVNKSCFPLVARCGFDTANQCHQFYKNECIMKNHICQKRNHDHFVEVSQAFCTNSENHCGRPIEDYDL